MEIQVPRIKFTIDLAEIFGKIGTSKQLTFKVGASVMETVVKLNKKPVGIPFQQVPERTMFRVISGSSIIGDHDIHFVINKQVIVFDSDVEHGNIGWNQIEYYKNTICEIIHGSITLNF